MKKKDPIEIIDYIYMLDHKTGELITAEEAAKYLAQPQEDERTFLIGLIHDLWKWRKEFSKERVMPIFVQWDAPVWQQTRKVLKALKKL